MASYAGSRFGVAVDCCTNALFLCCKYMGVSEVTLPSRTYVSVPGSVIHAGGTVRFEDVDWHGCYQLKPYPIYDSAQLFKRGMYKAGSHWCVSFSSTKPVNIGRGGMILTDDEQAYRWFRVARYMGRHECPHDEDTFEMVGWNMYMTPEQAARGLLLMGHVADDNPVKQLNYQDLSKYGIFKT